MYENRKNLRDIVTKVRTSEVLDQRGRVVANKFGKQKATLFHDILAEIIDREYELIMQEKSQLKRVA